MTPFFLYVSLMAPHDPRTMPQEYRALYDPAAIKLPANFLPEHPFDIGVAQIRDELLTEYPRDEDDIRRHIAEYYAMISHLDAQFGRLYDTLLQKGMLENSLIIFAGDNGLAVGQHGLMGKQNLYDYSLRVPLIISDPDVPAGEKRDTFCYLFNIFPTICDLLDIPQPESTEGNSLAECLIDADLAAAFRS